MNNFGVIELASAKTTNAPGWAYVPDTGTTPALAALKPSNRKRAARNTGNPSASDLSARQDAKVRKELDALDRDSYRDTVVAIPARANAGRATKSTPNVRKILQSQKTFANHLDDYQALLIQAETNPAAAAALLGHTAPTAKSTPTPAPTPKPAPSTKRTAAQKKSDAAAKRAATKAKNEAKAAAASEAEGGGAGVDGDGDVDMADAVPALEPKENEPEAQLAAEPASYPPDGTILPAYPKAPPKPHPSDDDPLLVSAVPPFPTDDELRALMMAPPLSYLEARAQCSEDENRYPARTFCEVCGYWGRVRCMKCGTRVCALDCLEMHRQECVTRYGL